MDRKGYTVRDRFTSTPCVGMAENTSPEPLNWTLVAALYLALGLGLVWMLYWGDYRNAAWLVLLGTGGGLTAYGRVKENQGAEEAAEQWETAAGLVYAVFFVWAAVVLIQSWMM